MHTCSSTLLASMSSCTHQHGGQSRRTTNSLLNVCRRSHARKCVQCHAERRPNMHACGLTRTSTHACTFTAPRKPSLQRAQMRIPTQTRARACMHNTRSTNIPVSLQYFGGLDGLGQYQLTPRHAQFKLESAFSQFDHSSALPI